MGLAQENIPNGYPLAFPLLGKKFLDRFRNLLRARGRFAFDNEVDRLSRVEQIVAFLALLELRKRGEAQIAQAGDQAPPELVQELDALQARGRSLAKLALALVTISAFAMSTARYW